MTIEVSHFSRPNACASHKMSNPADKMLLLEMAVAWRQLAERPAKPVER